MEECHVFFILRGPQVICSHFSSMNGIISWSFENNFLPGILYMRLAIAVKHNWPKLAALLAKVSWLLHLLQKNW